MFARSRALSSATGHRAPWRALAPFAALFVLMTACVAVGLRAIAAEADRSDAARAGEAVIAAFQFQHRRLELVTLNNAVYTAAARAVGGAKIDRAWAIENWTVSPPNLPGHYGILLIDSDGQPLVGTRAGKPLDAASLASLARMVRPVVDRLPTAGAVSTRAVVSSPTGPVMVAAANVVPEAADRTPESMALPRRRLALIHPIGPSLLATMNETIGGDDLRLGPGGEGANTVRFAAVDSPPFALSWRSRSPGKAAMLRSLRQVAPIYVLATLLLLVALRENLKSTRLLEQLASHDSLTGLLNRGRFVTELERSVGTRQHFALGLIDLNGFKLVNDNHGHLSGDDLLAAFAGLLQRLAAADTILGRLGGDEFGFITQNEVSAHAFAMRVRAALASPITTEAGSFIISASVGIAIAQDGLDARALIALADSKLYADKRTKTGARLSWSAT